MRGATFALFALAFGSMGFVIGGSGKFGGGGGIGSGATTPTISSLSVSSGCPADSPVLTGTGFTSVTSVDLNGTAASYAVNSATQITATVPNGATTGPWHVVTNHGTGTSGAFTLSACGFAYDLTRSTAPAGITPARTGGDVYAQTSASAVSRFVAGVAVPEDLGDGGGSGLRTFNAYSNDAPSYVDFTAVGWTTSGITITANAATDPAGGSTATNLRDTTTGTCGTVAVGPIGALDQIDDIASVWYRNGSPAPTPNAGLVGITTGGPTWGAFASTSTWTRAFTDYHKATFGNRQNYVYVSPASYTGASVSSGGTCDASAAGAVYAWGAQTATTRGFGINPVVVGSTGAATLQVTSGLASSISTNDMHLKGCYLADQFFQTTTSLSDTTAPRLWSMSTVDGESYMFWGSSTNISLVINGNTANTTSMNIGNLTQATQRPTLLCWEWYSQPSTPKNGFQVAVNGGRSVGTVAALVGGTYTMHTPSAMWIGSDLGNDSNAMSAVRHTALQSVSTDPNVAEGVILGDSLIANYAGHTALGSWLYTVAQARARSGTMSYAFPGETVAQQKARWDASPQKGQSYVKWVFVLIGNNNIGATTPETDSATATELQGLLADIHTANASAKIILAPNLPTNCAYTATQQGYFFNYNADIVGVGPNPITDPGGGSLVRLAPWTAISKDTTLTAPLTSVATTATVASTTLYPVSGTLLIDSEIVTYTGTTSTTFTGLTRATGGTTAASHAVGAAEISASTYCYQAQYDSGDHVHENDLAMYTAIAPAVSSTLTANGLLN